MTRRWNVLQRICQENAYSERLGMTREGWEQIRQRDHTFNALRGEQIKTLKKKDAQEEVIKEENIF
jgi:uncharacterized alpha-E superfamily protein